MIIIFLKWGSDMDRAGCIVETFEMEQTETHVKDMFQNPK